MRPRFHTYGCAIRRLVSSMLGDFAMPKPWDIPPRPQRGDKTNTPLYTAVGQAISAWEFVEFDLARLFAVFAGLDPRKSGQPAMRAFGTIVSYRARSEALKAAAKAFFIANRGTRLERPFTTLIKKCDNWSVRRNDIAHAAVLFTDRMNGHCLWPHPYVTKKYPLETRQATFCYRAVHVRKFKTAFRNLRSQTKAYVAKLEKKVEDRKNQKPLETSVSPPQRHHSPQPPDPQNPP